MDHNQFIQLIELLQQHRVLPIEEIARRFSVEYDTAYQWIDSLIQFDDLITIQEGDKIALNKSLDLLKHESIKLNLDDNIMQCIAELSIHTSLASTNEFLRKKLYSGAGTLLCLAEHQTFGRGRRGKKWISPFGQNIYLSILTRCRTPNKSLGAVSLIVGLGVVEALQTLGVDGLKIKWPNDIYWQDQKLAGILIEAKEIRENFGDLVIGVGLNVNMDKINASVINQAWTALNQILDKEIYRNVVAAKLIQHIMLYVQAFEEKGFDAFINQWQDVDYLLGKEVRVNGIAHELNGVAKGINMQGELLVANQGKTSAVNAGEVSVRLTRSGES